MTRRHGSNWNNMIAFLMVLCLIGMGTGSAYGQAVSADLTGSVTDNTGAVVSGATVTVENTATGFKANTTTNGNGEYRFQNLQVGTFNITVTAKGFSPANVKNYTLALNKIGTQNFTLAVGAGSTTIDVVESSVAVDTSTDQLQNSYDSKLTQDLPSSSTGLGVLNLSLLNAGVASSGGVGAGTGPSVGGQRPRNNNFTIEGVDVNSKGVTGPLITPPNDAVSDFTLLTNQFSAEYGHSSGGQFNTVIVSGTNKFHGRLYEYFQNRKLNATDRQSKVLGLNPLKPRYDNNRFGGQVGGPIIKNKVFFFSNWEYQPIGQSASSGACAPTAAGYALITPALLPGLSVNNLSVLKTYNPAAPAQDVPTGACTNKINNVVSANVSVNGTLIPIGPVQFGGASYNNNLISTSSGDWNISSKDQVRARYIYDKNTGLDTAAQLPAFWISNPTKYHVFTFSEYHIFNPSINNELRLGFNRYANTTVVPGVTFPGLTVFPNLTIGDLNSVNIGPDGNAPQFGIQNTYQLVDNISWKHGNHDLKLGFEYRKYIAPQQFTQRARGDYQWDTLENYLRDYAPDPNTALGFAERSTGNFPYAGDQYAVYGYINDTWKYNNKLSLNLGVRYEFTKIPAGEGQQKLNSAASVPGLVTFRAPSSQKKNFAPRLGFVYSPTSDGKTAIRGGFSMAYDVLYDNIGVLSGPPQLSSTCDTNNGGNASVPSPGCNYSPTAFLAGGGLPGSGGGFATFPTITAQRQATASFIVDQMLPYSESWNLGIQHEFAKKYTLEVRYLGSKGIHLPTQARLNRQAKTSSTQFLPTFLTAPSQATLDSMTTTFATINANSSFVPAWAAAGFNGSNVVSFPAYGQSKYNGLSTQLDRRFDNGLQFRMAYTWSHIFDNSTADFFTTVLTPRRAQDWNNFAGEMNTSALDRRHRLTFQAYYDLPFFQHDSNWAKKNILGNWLIAPVFTIQSPEFVTVRSGVDTNGNGDGAGDRAIFNTAGVPGTSTGSTALCTSSLPVGVSCGSTASRPFLVAYVANNSTAQYIKAGLLGRSTSGRNNLSTPRINNIDLTLEKKFNVTEGSHLEFQMQALNLLNHHQYIPGSLNQINSIGYTGGAVTNALIAGSATFANWSQVFSSQPRAITLVMKFVF